MTDKRPRVLILTGNYLPGFKGGGPIQSITNLVSLLSDSFNFYIVTSDRDLGDSKPYPNIIENRWNELGNASVYYVKRMKLSNFIRIVKSIEYDILYLNSFFSFQFSILPLFLSKLRLLNNENVILAPRGEFSPGAIKLKRFKKEIFIHVSKLIRLHSNVHWHATAQTEAVHVKKMYGANAIISVASNLPIDIRSVKYSKNLCKSSGRLKLTYIARIHPMKNLLQVLQLLKNVQGVVEFSIYGPIEDLDYWNKCKIEIAQLPSNVNTNYLGELSHVKVYDVYKANHVSILLTNGENFGHSIIESLISGCPIIISDRTPWENLEKLNAGFSFPLSKEELFLSAIDHYLTMDNNRYQEASRNAYKYALDMVKIDNIVCQYRELFNLSK